jgi:thimet oligopeptidase
MRTLSFLLLFIACAHTPAPPGGASSAAGEIPVHRAVGDQRAVDVSGLSYRYTKESLAAACQAARVRADGRITALAALPRAQRTFVSTFAQYDAILAEYLAAVLELGFLKDVHPDEKVRGAAAECETASNTYLVQLGARKDLFLTLKEYADGAGKTAALAPVDRQLMFLVLRDFRRNGMELSDADRDRLVQLRSRLAELSTKFMSNLDENQDSFTATEEELAGMPKDYVARLKKTSDGKRTITTKYPDYFPLMESAKSEELRKRAYFAFNGRSAKENLPILREAVALREEAAHLLGYATHADFVADTRMAKNARTVEDFLERLKGEVKGELQDLNARMLALKRAETKNPKARLESWDAAYYMAQIKTKRYAVDNERVRAYFPADKVFAGMLEVYSRLLHVAFKEVQGADVWVPGVKLYEVHDLPSDRLLAKFYVDLFPRPGKFGHAASFPLSVGHEVAGGYQIPLVALVTNFDPPQDGKPSHLNEKEVSTLFHEFGHIMHECLTTSPYVTMAGTNVSLDFVEAPSQMLENWVYQPEVLALISVDPKNVQRPMPSELARAMVAARTYDAGYYYSRQAVLSLLDLRLHTHDVKVEPDAVEQKLWHDTMGYPVYPEEHMPASFGHLMNGYDGGYYGYMWSKVFAQDMFSRFEREGVLNTKTGKEYRDIILASGQTEDAEVLLQRFLGRAPNEQAFLRVIGVVKGAPPGASAPSAGMHAP